MPVEQGAWPRDDNPLKHAPHTAETLLATQWTHAYAREEAAYPLPYLHAARYWSPVGRVDNGWCDPTLSSECTPM